MKSKLFLFFCLFLFFLTAALPVFALEITYPNLPPPFDALSPNVFLKTSPQDALPLFIKYLYSLLMWLGTAAAFIIFAWGGLTFIAARNNPSQIASAREKLSAAFFGFLILFSSWVILNTINPNLTWLEIPEIKKIEVPDFSKLKPLVSGEYKTSIPVELPFGALIERLFNKNEKWQEYTQEETKLFEEEFKKEENKHFTKLVLDVSGNTIKLSEQLLKNSKGTQDFKGLKQLSEDCSCSNSQPRCSSSCSSIPNNPLKIPEEDDPETIGIIEKYNQGSSCSGDPCLPETRQKLIDLQKENQKLIDEKFKKELLKQKMLVSLLEKELEKLEFVDDFIKKCPASMLLSLRNLGLFIDELKKNDWYIGGERQERWFVFDFEIWKGLAYPKEAASFYCPVSGNLLEKSLEPGYSPEEEERIAKELEKEEPSFLTEEYACSQEIPVGEIIDRAKRLANRLIERLEKMFSLSQQLIKEVDNLHILISQCSSQVPRCKSSCVLAGELCLQSCQEAEEGPCPKSKIEETIKKIEKLVEIKKEPASVETTADEEGIKNVFDTVLRDNEQKVGIKQIIDEIAPKLLYYMNKKVKFNMQSCVKSAQGQPELASCEQAINLKGEYGYIEACCKPQKTEGTGNEEKKEDSFEKCLQKCYLTAGYENETRSEGDKYKKCLTECLAKEAEEKGFQDIKKCNHFINFYCCR